MAQAVTHPVRAAASPAYQAYQVLHFGYTVLPIIAGLDKFYHVLVNWDMYLAPQAVQMLPAGIDGHTLMYIVGGIEILAGVLVAFRPKIGGYLVAFWLMGIIANLLLFGSWYDIALRDFGLCLGALALARLSDEFRYRRMHA